MAHVSSIHCATVCPMARVHQRCVGKSSFIAKNPSLKIADSPLSDWIKWESNSCKVLCRSDVAWWMGRRNRNGSIQSFVQSQRACL